MPNPQPHHEHDPDELRAAALRIIGSQLKVVRMIREVEHKVFETHYQVTIAATSAPSQYLTVRIDEESLLAEIR